MDDVALFVPYALDLDLGCHFNWGECARSIHRASTAGRSSGMPCMALRVIYHDGITETGRAVFNGKDGERDRAPCGLGNVRVQEVSKAEQPGISSRCSDTWRRRGTTKNDKVIVAYIG